jgi:CheY-like chemotaxis protein
MVGRILIIEDDPPSLELVEYLCRMAGYQTLTASDGLKGLLAARSALPDLILCDLQMPELNGYQVLQHLKEDPNCRSIPIVAVSAFSMSSDRDKALAAGFDAFFSKPIDPEFFVPLIVEFLSPSQRATSLPDKS